MTPDSLRDACLALPQATETFPFGEQTSVFKTSGNDKIFAIAALGAEPLSVTLKCDQDESIALRAEFTEITPGYHMNKRLWVTVGLEGVVPDELVEQLLAASHALVRPRLPLAATDPGTT